ncbi:SDR family NAD(P)-dependent oxidoreductase [Pleionea sediminis]|uniref:SDR family NAD(P)-dependent oxidoreductase n=1 Tax=Pleionea sediminis TaxID=2569479 RepID=UPI0011860D2B|nr:SDR family NAD(P)-dependent oxidoreductase [Pleionea sediminis]
MSKEIQQGRRAFLTKAAVASASLTGGMLMAGAANANSVTAASDANKTSSKSYDGKTAFVTGGARGIGLATAEMFAANGANVVIFDIASGSIKGVQYPVASEADLSIAKNKIESYGVNCLVYKGDVRDRDAQSKAMKETVNRFGSLDFVVANAGVTQIGELEKFTDQQVDAVIDINVGGVVKTTQAAMPYMQQQKSGRIVYISSILGRQGDKDWPVYSASKWAVIGFAKSTAHLLGKDGITCNVICPGLVNTHLVNNPQILGAWLPNSPNWESVNNWLKNNNTIPMGAYEPEDIAAVVKLFCEPATKTVTGEIFDIAQGAAAKALG